MPKAEASHNGDKAGMAAGGAAGGGGAATGRGGARVRLRLDSGAIIGDAARLGQGEGGGAVLLQPEAAEELGLVGEQDLVRLHCLVNLEERQRRGSGAQAGPRPDGGERGIKRRRSLDAAPSAPGDGPLLSGSDNGRASPTALSGGAASSAPPPADWIARCVALLESLRKEMKDGYMWFEKPVDPLQVKDYYTVVKTPMDLGTIRSKLDSGAYQRPADFALDVRQVWINCALYNRKGDVVERVGSAGSVHFESQWQNSGMAESKDRSRRSNAGLAAAKFEPVVGIATKKPKGAGGAKIKSPTARSAARSGGGGGGSKASRRPKAAGGGRGGGAGSGGGREREKMSQEAMVELATKLSEMDEAALDGVITIVRENTDLGKGSEGEIELDIEQLDNNTLWLLHNYVESLGGGGRPAPAASGAAADSDNSSGDDSDSSTESDS